MNLYYDPITSEKLEEKGQSMYRASKTYLFLGIFGIVFMNIICLICVATGGDYTDPLIMHIHHSYAWAGIFIIVAYMCIFSGIIGIPMYFYGIIIFALGRIAYNTEKPKSENKENVKKSNENYKKKIKTVINDNSKGDESDITIRCPNCGESLYFQKFDLESGEEIVCPMCDHIINYK